MGGSNGTNTIKEGMGTREGLFVVEIVILKCSDVPKGIWNGTRR